LMMAKGLISPSIAGRMRFPMKRKDQTKDVPGGGLVYSELEIFLADGMCTGSQGEIGGGFEILEEGKESHERGPKKRRHHGRWAPSFFFGTLVKRLILGRRRQQ